ncbi:ankyrin repeat domain-containing protein SOWAHA-like [Thalassophryne amazonica]|uniref:ankyrin repeat domain-containing protein SOWAHA-like n=1 Tax=Thalassophryne amazonica TaxID=390379 RepID=UPI001470D929|nr:ankyrin repeat domain-containing protein SOWAHA-like [Thalassophryne amazonica]
MCYVCTFPGKQQQVTSVRSGRGRVLGRIKGHVVGRIKGHVRRRFVTKTLLMALTQESVLSVLIAEGGKVKKSDLVAKFKGSFDCEDPTEKERNKELFKTFVNNAAFVKEVDGVKYVFVRKKYQHLLEDTESVESCGGEEPWAESPVQLALQRIQSKSAEFRVQKALRFQISQWEHSDGGENTSSTQSALPPSSSTIVEIHKLKADLRSTPDAFRNESKMCFLETNQPKKVANEEPKEPRFSSVVPLEQSEHQWFVKCAAGHWSQVYVLLLTDTQLAEKRDFMSGFTVLHWAAKWGNTEMLEKIIELSRLGGVDVNINARTHGGYTPLHIAALHAQEYILAMLVEEYGANISVRDNCGKKAYHYLSKGISTKVREMLGDPRSQLDQEKSFLEREELDLLPDLSKSLHSISRLFQPHLTGPKKKHKLRPSLYSLTNEAEEEQEDSTVSRPRPLSEVFM